jgi:hypothetical protein
VLQVCLACLAAARAGRASLAAWVAGSVVIGVLVSVSLPGLVAFCAAAELAAIPFILIVRKRSAAAVEVAHG